MTKSLKWLLSIMLEESSLMCSTDTHRDLITLSRRIKHEGDSFVTITLPSFCSDFEKSLDIGLVDSRCFLGFKRHRALPVFLRGLLSQVFDPECGVLLDKPSSNAIFAIRQICLVAKKLKSPCSNVRTRRSYDGYVQLEKELTGPADLQPNIPSEVWRAVADCICSGVFAELNGLVVKRSTTPRHGPGATAEGIFGNKKFALQQWHTRLQPWFPYDHFGSAVVDLDRDPRLGNVKFVEPGAETPVRVVAVPKTLAKARIIAIEPVCMQYAQQALMAPMVESIESGALTAGHVNFRDQSINRKLALESSASGKFATIDLSEASDRVHKDYIYAMLKSVPDLRDAIFACRSYSADVNGTIVALKKFASMGSALCFPVESIFFYIICISGRLEALRLRPTPGNIRNVARGVYVYGDDIIVPKDEVESICTYLEGFSLKVNERKTFGIGKFRESCGMDAYDGVDVTPVYLRHMPPADRRDTPEIVSFVSFANQLYKKGWWKVAKRVREMAENLIGPLPHVRETSPCLGWHSFKERYDFQRWDNDLHCPMVKGYAVRPMEYHDPLDGYDALLKFFLKAGDKPLSGGHLERSVRPGSVRTKYRWVRPF